MSSNIFDGLGFNRWKIDYPMDLLLVALKVVRTQTKLAATRATRRRI
jgi:hypothetical protein